MTEEVNKLEKAEELLEEARTLLYDWPCGLSEDEADQHLGKEILKERDECAVSISHAIVSLRKILGYWEEK